MFLFYDWEFLHVRVLQENLVFYFNSWLSFQRLFRLFMGIKHTKTSHVHISVCLVVSKKKRIGIGVVCLCVCLTLCVCLSVCHNQLVPCFLAPRKSFDILALYKSDYYYYYYYLIVHTSSRTFYLPPFLIRSKQVGPTALNLCLNIFSVKIYVY